MIRAQRKYHFLVWLLLALLLPAAFCLAIVYRPASPVSPAVEQRTFVANLQDLTDSTSLLRIRVGHPLTVPSCLLFNRIENEDVLLGKLDSRGPYTFIIPRPAKYASIKLYDAIHKETIATLNVARNP